MSFKAHAAFMTHPPPWPSRRRKYLWTSAIILLVAALTFYAWHALTTRHHLTVSASGGARAINEAIAKLPADGGEIQLGPGAYLCSEPVIIARSGVTLRGMGHGTLLRLADNANCPVLIIGDIAEFPRWDTTRVTVEGLRIDGNRAKQTSECWNGLCDTGEVTVIRSSGVVLRLAVDVRVASVVAGSCRSGGIVTEKNCRRVTLQDIDASDNEFDGLACYETRESTFTNLKLHGNKAAGLSTDIHFDDNLLSNVILTDNATHGIFMRDSSRNSFQGVMITRSGRDAVFLDQVEDKPETAAKGNSFIGLHVSDSKGAALKINNASCVGTSLAGYEFSGNTSEVSAPVPGLIAGYTGSGR